MYILKCVIIFNYAINLCLNILHTYMDKGVVISLCENKRVLTIVPENPV